MYTPEPSEENQGQATPDQFRQEDATPLAQGIADSAPQDSALDTESIQRGLIYPPPPTYYEREEHVSHASKDTPIYTPPAAQKEQAQQYSPPPSFRPYPSDSQQAGSQSYYPTTSYPPTPGYPPGVQPPFLTVPPRQKKSRKWLWISLSILAVVILLSCGLCSWAAYPIVTQAYQQASSAVYGSQDLVNNYYSAIQNQQYSQAYTYLTSQGSDEHLTQTQFVQEAQQRDKQYGPVYSFTAGAPSVNHSDVNGQTIDHFTVDITVARAKSKYTVHLSAQKINGAWKIQDFNQI
jgi:hypothetical protein